MTQEEKQLLLSDLCARLPYYTMVLMDDGGVELLVSVNVDTGICNGLKGLPKPYLRPISSMTEKEANEWHETTFGQRWITFDNVERCVDWLLSHHFDYRGLIEKGLALEAPADMYKSE